MKRLFDYLPENYDGSRETRIIQDAIQPEMDWLWEVREDFLKQLFVDSATWGLRLWEDALGLGYDPELGIDVRRSRVKAKLRGAVTTTPEVVRDTVGAYTDGTVTVEELPRQWAVVITVETAGLPLYQEERMAAILKEIMPAHLTWRFVVRTPPVHWHGAVGVDGMSVAADPLPLVPDRLDYMGALRVGGIGCSHLVTPVPELN